MKVLRYADGGLTMDRMMRVLGVWTEGRRRYREALVARGFIMLGDGKLDVGEEYVVVMPDGERVACFCRHNGRGLSEMVARKVVEVIAKRGIFGKWKETRVE